MERMFKYSDDVYSIIDYGKVTYHKMEDGMKMEVLEKPNPIKIGDEVDLSYQAVVGGTMIIKICEIVEVIEQRKGFGLYENEDERPIWAKIRVIKK